MQILRNTSRRRLLQSFAFLFVGWIFVAVNCAFALDSGPKRLALVIGNDEYKNVDPLTNARNDAKLFSTVLMRAGFDVTVATDLNRDSFWSAIETFKNRINKGDEVVFYYAGHGVQIASNQLLLPVDIKAQSDTQVQRDGVSLVEVQDALKDARFAMFVIDACRDNPFPKQGTRSIGTTRGLLPPEPATGQVIIMSAGRNQKALDSVPGVKADNGLFTYELTQVLQQPGVEIRTALEKVKSEVDDAAKKVGHEQRPSMVNDLRGDFYFFGPTTVQVIQQGTAPAAVQYIAPAKTAEQIEDETWDSVKDSADLSSLEEYLRQYPKGRHAGQARVAIAKVKADAKRAAGAPAAVMPATPAAIASPVAAGGSDAESALWQAVSAGNTAEDYGVYIQQYPRGKYLPLARQRIKKLDDDSKTKAQAEELAAWQVAEAAQTLDGYQAYEQRYPKGQYLALSQTRVRKLKADQARQQETQAWNVAQKGDSKTVSDYLESYPRGGFVLEATKLLAKLKKEEAEMRPGKIFRDCPDCPEMVIVPAGNFMMGGSGIDEGPTHEVNVKSFAMGKTAVTQGEWQSLMGANPSYFKLCGSSCPVENVSWNDAQDFVQKLNAKTGKNYRLPSESQWEYACRAGGRHEYCGSDNVDAVGWYDRNSGKSTHSVAGKQPNAFGLYDMSGNVWEWVEDWYHDNYNGAPTDGSAWVSGGEQKSRVLRGGSWNYGPTWLRSALRVSYTPGNRYGDDGFRLARTLVTP